MYVITKHSFSNLSYNKKVLLHCLQTGQTIKRSVEELQSRIQHIKETGELAPGMMFKSACQMQKERAKI